MSGKEIMEKAKAEAEKRKRNNDVMTVFKDLD